MTALAIETNALTRSFGATLALGGVDLQVELGQILAVLGPNGAGKTTLIRILSTLLEPTSGTARVCGLDVRTYAERVRRLLSVTSQYAAVDEVLSGRENLVMVGRLLGLRGARARTRASQLLDEFGLTDAADRRAKTYSGGMRRRLDLALSLVGEPRVVILDEPTTGLDARARHELWRAIRALADGGAAVLLTTQYLEEADRLADEIALINQGVVAAHGTPAELKSAIGDVVVETRSPAGTLRDETATDGTARHLAAIVARIAATQPDARVTVRGPSLDDVFLRLTAAPDSPARSLADHDDSHRAPAAGRVA